MSHLALDGRFLEICRKDRSVRQDVLSHLSVLGTADQGSRQGNH